MSTENDYEKEETKALSQIAVMCSFYFFLIKWLVLKPLVKLSYIINGKQMGKIRWYQRSFSMPIRWKWLNTITYKLTKYVHFR